MSFLSLGSQSVFGILGLGILVVFLTGLLMNRTAWGAHTGWGPSPVPSLWESPTFFLGQTKQMQLCSNVHYQQVGYTHHLNQKHQLKNGCDETKWWHRVSYHSEWHQESSLSQVPTGKGPGNCLNQVTFHCLLSGEIFGLSMLYPVLAHLPEWTFPCLLPTLFFLY